MIIGISTVRNEGDILLQVLQHASPHFDLILVVDVCSWDDTPQVIEKAVATLPNIVSLGRLDKPMLAEAIRPEIWSRFSPHLPPDSWWGFVDADEFVEGDIRAAVEEAERTGADYIEGASALFSYTAEEAEAWQRGEETLQDRKRPIHERRRFYRMNAYSVRVFRHHPRLRWPSNRGSPMGLIRPLPWRLNFRHYQYRDYEQIKTRWQTRQEIDVSPEFARIHFHWFHKHFEDFVDNDKTELNEWHPGAPLIPSTSLPAVRVPYWLDRIKRRRHRFQRSWTPQPAPTLFSDVDVPAVVQALG